MRELFIPRPFDLECVDEDMYHGLQTLKDNVRIPGIQFQYSSITGTSIEGYVKFLRRSKPVIRAVESVEGTSVFASTGKLLGSYADNTRQEIIADTFLPGVDFALERLNDRSIFNIPGPLGRVALLK